MKKMITIAAIIALIIYILPVLDQKGYLSKLRGAEIIGEDELVRTIPSAKFVFDIKRMKPFIKNLDASTEDSLKATMIDLRFHRDGKVTSDTNKDHLRFYKIVDNVLSIYDPEPPRSIAESFKKRETTPERAAQLYKYDSAYNVYIVKGTNDRFTMENSRLFCRIIIYLNPIIAQLNEYYDFQNPIIACSFPLDIRR